METITYSPAGYPRPQLRRNSFINLNGVWQFAIDHDGKIFRPGAVDYDRQILVPFAPETPASLVDDRSYYKAVWYRRDFDSPVLKDNERLILHFGAVDWHARVFVNGDFAVEHDGGYTPFSVDITDFLNSEETQTLVLHAQDNPFDLEKNRGKQDWEEQAHSIWYPRTTGIWQTVWLEVVPECRLSNVRWATDEHDWSISLSASLQGVACPDLRVRIKLTNGHTLIADNAYALSTNEKNCQNFTRKLTVLDSEISVLLPDESKNDLRQQLLWHPDHPNLIDAVVELVDAQNAVVDRVHSYTAFRRVETNDRRVLINGEPEILRLALDQGYWLETGMTAPSDDAIKLDIELMKQAGFNGARKHNKLEDPRFLYWADVLGFYVWEELPSAYLFTPLAMERSSKTWLEAIERDRNHPCIIAWVPINESWGLPDLPGSALQREFQRSMYRLTKAFTGGALVIGNDGWQMVESDILAIHDYDADVSRIKDRYEDNHECRAHLFANERPGRRVLLLDDMKHEGKPMLLTEFGGIKCSREAGTWGYSVATSADDFAQRYKTLMQTICALPVLGGFCYTEFTDVYQEANGLFWMDRQPKFDVQKMWKATRGVS
jgi:beta-galactosidase/beta-glucuronidase